VDEQDIKCDNEKKKKKYYIITFLTKNPKALHQNYDQLGMFRYTSVIPALRKMGQRIERSRPAWATQGDHVSKYNKNKQQTKIKILEEINCSLWESNP
jgi:hypothetical protein